MNKQLAPSVKYLRVELNYGYDEETVKDLDMDIVAFLLDDRDIVVNSKDVVFFNNHQSENQAVELLGGWSVEPANDMHDVVVVKPDRIPERITKVVFCVCIYQYDDHQFGQADKAVLSLLPLTDPYDKGEAPLLTVDLVKEYPLSSGMSVFQLSRTAEGWEYGMNCESVDFGIRELCARYGLAVDD